VSGTDIDVAAARELTARELERHLVAARIAGDVLTPRESNLDHARRFAAGEPGFQFGLPPRDPWSYERVAALMVERVGIDPDLSRETGPDTIDPALTRAALDRLRDRLVRAAADRQRVLLATGHPSGILDIHLGLAEALRRAGATLLTPGAGAVYQVPGGYADRPRGLQVRHLGGVATAADSANLWHSHAPEGMTAMLAALAASGGPAPDLVIADHGFAGAAAQAGLDVASFADSNDPALFVGEAEGRVGITVPLDDNVLPHLYRPVVGYLLAGWAD
jgi:Phosphatase